MDAIENSTLSKDDGIERDIWNAGPSLWVGFRTFLWCGLVSMVCLILAVTVSCWALLGVVIAIPFVLIRVLQIRSHHYQLTTQRLRITKGYFNREIIEIELFRIRDLTLEQGFIQRFLTIGTVKAISTDEDAPEIVLSCIKDAMQVKENLRRYVMESRKATGTRDVDTALAVLSRHAAMPSVGQQPAISARPEAVLGTAGRTKPRRSFLRKAAIACVGLVVVLIFIGYMLDKREEDQRAVLTPGQRAAEDKQRAGNAAEHEAKKKADAAEAAKQRDEANRNAKAEPDAMRLAEPVAVAKPPEQPPRQTITYEVLEKRTRGDGKFILEILVGEDSSRQDVMALAASLAQQYAGQYAEIDIFDSREAQKARLDETYPEKEFWKHFLVMVGNALDPAKSKEIKWIAEGSTADLIERKARKAAELKERQARKAAEEAAKWRTWTDASGEHKIEAKYGGMVLGVVKLTKRDGSTVKVSLEKLSGEDQDWIKKLFK